MQHTQTFHSTLEIMLCSQFNAVCCSFKLYYPALEHIRALDLIDARDFFPSVLLLMMALVKLANVNSPQKCQAVADMEMQKKGKKNHPAY